MSERSKDNSAAILDRLNADLAKEEEDVAETEQSAANLEVVLADFQEELKATKRQRIRDIMKHPDREEVLEETYDELESDLLRRIEGIQNQIAMTVDKRNTIIQVNRAAKTAMEVFNDILAKPKLDRNDLQLIIQKIRFSRTTLKFSSRPMWTASCKAARFRRTSQKPWRQWPL